jgi:GABA permease
MTNALTPTRAATATSLGQKPRRGPAERRLLVVVDEPCTSPELCASIRAYAGGRPLEALVIAPAHDLPATQWYVDEEAARADATHRLRACVACLGQDGIRVRGELGDGDPVHAIGDALYEFPADEILLISASQRPSRWLRQNVIDRARDTFPQPVTHVVMPTGPEREPA